jgi:hypothetical protein
MLIAAVLPLTTLPSFFDPSRSKSATHSIFANLGDSLLFTTTGTGAPPDMMQVQLLLTLTLTLTLTLKMGKT